jgi:hypothetical protein
MVPKTFSNSKFLLEISEHIHIISHKHLLQKLIGIKTFIAMKSGCHLLKWFSAFLWFYLQLPFGDVGPPHSFCLAFFCVWYGQ